MIKFKYDLEKNKQRIKALMPSLFELIVFVVACNLLALSFEFDWQTFGNCQCYCMLAIIIHTLCWLIDAIIYTIIKKKSDKKENLHD